MRTTYFKILMLFCLIFSIGAQAQQAVTTADLQKLEGPWTGSLTYIDYSSNKPYTMPANLRVAKTNKDTQLTLYNIYPNEPKANNKDKLKISKDGLQLNNQPVKSREILNNGDLQIITEYEGKDNNKKALIRNIYLLGEKQFIIRKEVKYEDSDEWFKRNEFNYKRPH